MAWAATGVVRASRAMMSTTRATMAGSPPMAAATSRAETPRKAALLEAWSWV
jgi:hypothetical protein